MITYVLRTFYNEKINGTIDRVTAQGLLDKHAKGITTYAYSMLYFAYNCNREDVETIDKFTSQTILDGFKTSYEKTRIVHPHLDEKALTLPKVVSKIDPIFAEQAHGSLQLIYPTILTEEDDEIKGIITYILNHVLLFSNNLSFHDKFTHIQIFNLH